MREVGEDDGDAVGAVVDGDEHPGLQGRVADQDRGAPEPVPVGPVGLGDAVEQGVEVPGPAPTGVLVPRLQGLGRRSEGVDQGVVDAAGPGASSGLDLSLLPHPGEETAGGGGTGTDLAEQIHQQRARKCGASGEREEGRDETHGGTASVYGPVHGRELSCQSLEEQCSPESCRGC